MLTRLQLTAVLPLVMLTVFGVSCGKKKPIAPPPPATPQTTTTTNTTAKPTVEFTAEPGTLDRGQSALLKWTVSDATYISIDTFGAVQATGSRSVSPYASTTYHLTADGPGGRTLADATLTVNVPAPVAPVAEAPSTSTLTVDQRVAQQVTDVFFGYDKYDATDDARATLTKDAAAIKSIVTDFPNAVFMIEGHCDDRGSAEYNLALGDRRAASSREFLVQLGVAEVKLRTVSYGKERPQCTEADESCYARNRRAHFALAQ